MSKKTITVLMVEPNEHPKATELHTDLDSLQKAVSIGADYQGLIELVNLVSLSPELMEIYKTRFWEPETWSSQDVEHAMFMRFFMV